MDNRIGVIDLGSNTFHLLVAKITAEGFDEIYRERCFIGLAEGGIKNLSDEAMDRGIEALSSFRKKLDEMNIEDYQAIGTAALRTASNGHTFIQKAKEAGIHIQVIEGNREAELIYKGARTIIDLKSSDNLIMDIGGGSVEFILVSSDKIIYSHSFDIGVGILKENFHSNDPISISEINTLRTFIKNEVTTLFEAAKPYQIESIIGASGSFEVLESMNGYTKQLHSVSTISLGEFKKVYDQILHASEAERSRMEGLPPSRVKLIVVALILIDIIIENIQPQSIKVSPYALKEGVIAEQYEKIHVHRNSK